MARRFVRRATCPTCGLEVGITRGELRRRIAQCVCGVRFALEVRGGEGDPHRSMQQVQPRVLMAGPPTARIEEWLGPLPTLIIRQERGKRRRDSWLTLTLGATLLAVSAVYRSTAGLIFSALYLAVVIWELRARHRLRVVDGVLEYRGPLVSERVRLADLDGVDIDAHRVILRRRGAEPVKLLEEALNQSDAARQWIAEWIREHARRA